MKKRLIGAVLSAVVLMILFTACSDDTQEVRIVGYAQADTVSRVSVEQTSITYNNAIRYVIITWDAIENGTDYTVYVKQDGKKSIVSLGSGTNAYSYSTADGSSTNNYDFDKWSLRIKASDIVGTGSYISSSYRFGVSASDSNPNHTYSDIVWSDTIYSP